MSGLTSFRKKQEQAPAEFERDPKACWANGCICPGSVALEGGRKFCSFHAYAEDKDWNRITSEMRGLRWFTDLMLDVQKAALDSEWIPLVESFWKGEDHYMMPTESEKARKHNYWIRLHGEYAYRLGVRRDRPRPIEPVSMGPRRKVDGWANI